MGAGLELCEFRFPSPTPRQGAVLAPLSPQRTCSWISCSSELLSIESGRGRWPRRGGAALRMTPLRPCPCAPPALLGAASPSCPPPPLAWSEHARALHADALQDGDTGPAPRPPHPLNACRFLQPCPRTLTQLCSEAAAAGPVGTIAGKLSHRRQPSPFYARPFSRVRVLAPTSSPWEASQDHPTTCDSPGRGSLKAPAYQISRSIRSWAAKRHLGPKANRAISQGWRRLVHALSKLTPSTHLGLEAPGGSCSHNAGQ